MEPQTDLAPPRVDYRHPWPVRTWHWANAAAIVILLMTGLLIFDIHPHLYWGEDGLEGVPAFVSLTGTNLDRIDRVRFDLKTGEVHQMTPQQAT